MRKLHTYESAETLRTPSQFRKAYARNMADHDKVTDAMIAAGRGHWRNAETAQAAKDGDPLALHSLALSDETHALCYRAKNWFGVESYMV